MKTAVLDFTGCVEMDYFFDRIIEALGLGVGYCGRNWSAIYDFSRTEIIPEKLEITGSSSLKGYLELLYSRDLFRILEKIKEYYEKYNEEFEYEVID